MRTVSVEELHHIESLIRNCTLCYVGMADEQGVPYVLPMNFGYDEEVIYLHTCPRGSFHIHPALKSTGLHHLLFDPKLV